MTNALAEAERLGLDTVQVFTKNQQQWKAKPLAPEAIDAWKLEIARLKWHARTVSHASYLINLASPNDELWEKSVALMRDEIERCESLEIPFLVHHPGAFTTSTLDQGLQRIVDAYERLFRETRGYRCVSCLEGTVGGGSTIGGRFEHLAALRERIAHATGAPDRIGFCLDTCHLHAAGYDMSSRDGAQRVLEEFDQRCGIPNIRVWHINDCKSPMGSKLDRHAHIGCGTIGRGPLADSSPADTPAPHKALAASGFAAVIAHPAFVNVPKILETPKEDRKPGEPWDRVNLRALRRLRPDAGAEE